MQPAVQQQLQAELDAGVKTAEYYATLAPAAERIKHELLRFLLQAKADGKRVVGYGAAAKGNTLLNYAGVKPDLLAWVADANPHKQGKFLPGSRIPIVAPERIALEQPDYMLVLPWNLLSEVTQQLACGQAWGGRFVVAVPELSHPMSRIHYTKPSVGELEAQYALDAVQNGWGARCYEYLTRFEHGFAEHLGATYAIATSSCTGALHMGMAALGIGAGDEVILANTNWIASAAPITYLGATPVFVDVLAGQLVPGSGAGQAGDHPAHQGDSRGAPVRQSVRHGRAARHRSRDRHPGHRRRRGSHRLAMARPGGRLAGGVRRFFVSWHQDHDHRRGRHVRHLGQGLVRACADPVQPWSCRGQTKQFWPEFVGFKYKMSNLQAAVGCAQVERIDELIERKRAIFANYAPRAGMRAGRVAEPRTGPCPQRLLDADGGVRCRDRHSPRRN